MSTNERMNRDDATNPEFNKQNDENVKDLSAKKLEKTETERVKGGAPGGEDEIGLDAL
jgi:hypothetical protein